jgi:putative membrane protein
MKTITIAVVAILGAVTWSCTPEKDSVKQAQEQNQNSAIDENISKFLTEAADARMMDIELGKLAKERGTTPEIRQYGDRMVTDQSRLLQDLRTLAASKNIALPSTLSNEKAEGLADIKDEQGVEFDKKFMRMMTQDHKRDVRAFDDATDFKDQDVERFASMNLSMVESHLDQIQKIKEVHQSELSERDPDQDEN